eukprot:m.282585 g.282585  ORF g.282585 m.282585 type:complete len:73 (+) comp16338_c1_seq2:1634-1852(+)
MIASDEYRDVEQDFPQLLLKSGAANATGHLETQDMATTTPNTTPTPATTTPTTTPVFYMAICKSWQFKAKSN